MLGPEKVLQIIESYIDQGASPNLKDEVGRPLLSMVIIFMRINMHQTTNLPKRIIEKLLASGADINAVNREGESALFEAAINHLPNIVQLLLDYGADPNLKNKNGESIIDRANQLLGVSAQVKKVLDSYIY